MYVELLKRYADEVEKLMQDIILLNEQNMKLRFEVRELENEIRRLETLQFMQTKALEGFEHGG